MLHFDNYYHVFNHANGFENIFTEERNYYFFLTKYEEHISPIADLVTYCLMPNHFHLLIKVKNEDEIINTFPRLKKIQDVYFRELFLSKRFSNFFSCYTQAFNKVYERKGSVFMKSFKHKIIPDMMALKNVILYLHLNPVHHGFTPNFFEYDYSGFNTFQDQYPQLSAQLFGNARSYIIEHIEKARNYEFYDQLENNFVY